MRILAALLLLLLALPAHAAVLEGEGLIIGPSFSVDASGNVKAGSYTGSGVYNVLAYGAKCDGSTDDSAAFALANTAASPGGTIYVPAGTCRLNSQLNLSANVNLVGVPGSSIIKATVTNPVLLVIANTAGNNLIYGITFDGNSAAAPPSSTVVTVFNASNVVFDTDVFQNTIGIAVIFSTSVTFSGVRNSKFINVGKYADSNISNRHQAISFCCGTTANNLNNFVTGNSFYQFGLDAISVTSQTNFLASSNRCDTSTSQAGNGAGVACVYSNINNFINIVGNVARNVSGNALDSDTDTNVTISGNEVNNAGTAGIIVANDKNATVSGNVANNNGQLLGVGVTGQSGLLIFSGASCSGVTVSGNTFSDTQGSPTQAFGIDYNTAHNGGSCSNVTIAPNNVTQGNITSGVSTAANVLGQLSGTGFSVDGSGNVTSLTHKLTKGAFSALATCASGTEGTVGAVTDSTTNTWGATITGSGANHVLAYCDGTNWTVAGK